MKELTQYIPMVKKMIDSLMRNAREGDDRKEFVVCLLLTLHDLLQFHFGIRPGILMLERFPF